MGMTFYYVEDNFDFEYYVPMCLVRKALMDMLGEKGMIKVCEEEDLKDQYALAEWFRDDLKDYFEEEALEWYRENR